MSEPVQIVYVEDSQLDVELAVNSLRENGIDCNIYRVDSRQALIERINKVNPDLVLSDFSLTGFDGRTALAIVRALKPETPFIFVSGTIGEEFAITLLRHGATDYVLKDCPACLVSAVRRALSDAQKRSQLKGIQKRLQQSKRMEALGTMAGGIAHDFNNLLAVIKVNAGLLQKGKLSPEQIRQVADMLENAADRGANLTQELLIFGRKAAAKPVRLQLRNRIDKTVSLLKNLLPSTIRIDVQIDDILPPILMDASHLDRIVTNLITNAADAMPDGGVITISAMCDDRGNSISSVGKRNETTYLRLNIADTGTGMDAATREHALEPFYTTKPEGKGTGLGLSVVFGLMQINNGMLRIESEEGKGTVVSLFFPLDAIPLQVDSESPAFSYEKAVLHY